MIPTLHARVIAVLKQAGYGNLECSVPIYASGGTFSAIGGGEGANVAPSAGTRAKMNSASCARASLRRCGRPGWEVLELDTRVYVMAAGFRGC
jgi:hypothetical protein